MTKSVSYTTWMISMLVAIVLAIVLYANFDGLFSSTEKELTIREQYNLGVGDDLVITGVMASDGDLRFYTHTIEHEEYGLVGLRSRSNLNAYKGPVLLEGTIDSFLQDTQMMILQVQSITLLPEDMTDTEDMSGSIAQYIRAAGIYFPVAFFDIYSNLRTNTPGNITFQGAISEHAINYFRCTTDQSTTDCLHMQKNFTPTASKVFTTADGMTFYKMTEAESWFTHNDGLIGYFFNDISEPDMLNLTKHIDFPTLKSVEQTILPSIGSLCNDDSVRMGSADDYNLFVKSSMLYLAVTGTVGTQMAKCELLIDYNQPHNAIMTQFSVLASDETGPEETETDTEEEPTPTIRPTPFDSSVEQFPINLENPFIFTSNRGHRVIFPSQNIAFGPVDFDNNTVVSTSSCYAQQNLVSHANKPVLQTQPSIIIYECRLPADTNLPQQYISYPLEEGKNFIVYVVQGARRDFANNISVETLE